VNSLIPHRFVGLDEWRPSSRQILAVREVAAAFDVDPDALLGKARRREIAAPRAIAYYVLRRRFGLSYKQIARVFSRDHSTIIYGVGAAEGRIERSAQLAEIVHRLIEQRDIVFYDAHVIAWRITKGAAAMKERAAEPEVFEDPRPVKPKNALCPDDRDARSRAKGSAGLSAAIEAAGGWPSPRVRAA
jgi:hypothetical protein